MFWVCFDLWLGFFLSHFKYANGFSPSLFPIGRQSGCKVGEEPLSLVSDSDLKSLHTYVGYLVLMPPCALNLNLLCDSSRLRYSWLKAVVRSELCRFLLSSFAQEGLSRDSL